MLSSSKRSCSSSISPTICSMTSSIVTNPEMLVYSSTTTARWFLPERNSLNKTFNLLLSGINATGRIISRIEKSSALSIASDSKSLANNIPTIRSCSSSKTGNLECPLSIIFDKILLGLESSSIKTISDLGIIISLTCISETNKAPSIMATVSGSIMLFDSASRRLSTRSSLGGFSILR